MSSAFCKEEESELLSDISPTIPALKNYIFRENNNIRVHVVDMNVDESVTMSNGLTYIRKNHKWEII